MWNKKKSEISCSSKKILISNPRYESESCVHNVMNDYCVGILPSVLSLVILDRTMTDSCWLCVIHVEPLGTSMVAVTELRWLCVIPVEPLDILRVTTTESFLLCGIPVEPLGVSRGQQTLGKYTGKGVPGKQNLSIHTNVRSTERWRQTTCKSYTANYFGAKW